MFIKKKLSGIQRILCSNNSDQLRNLEKKLHDEYINILRCEEELWMTESIVTWLTLGDKKKTNFFSTNPPQLEGEIK